MQNQPPKILIPHSYHADWLDRDELAALTADKILRRLTELGDFVASHAAEAERQRYPVAEVWSAIRKSGLFYLLVPSEFGGLGVADFQVVIDAILIIAERCASTAWCAAQCTQHQLLVGMYPKTFQREIWGSLPYVTAAGSAFPPGRAVRVEGGYCLSGRYAWGSGIMYSQWVFGYGAVGEAGDTARSYCFFMPVEEVTVLDTWHVDGMAGSGSHDFVADDLFVPEHRALEAMSLNQGRADGVNWLQRLPLPVIAPIIVSLPILGAARSVIKSYRAKLMAAGPSGMPGGRAAEHACLARADISVKVAELSIRNVVDQARGLWSQTGTVPDTVRAHLRGLCSYAAELCRTAVRSVSDLAGSSAHLLSNPLQQAARDVNMLGTHVVLETSATMESLGRLMVGLPVSPPVTRR